MKARWKILIAVGIFMALSCVISLVTLRMQPENKVEAYKRMLRAQGEKLDIAELQPAPVPAASNSVDAVRAAFRMFGSGDVKVPDAMKMIAPGKALIGWRQPEVTGWGFTNTWEDFSTEITAEQPLMDLLQQVLERPRLDFELDYSKLYALLLPHLAPLKRATQKLDAAAIDHLHNADCGAATTNILTILGLVHANAGEGIMISHLVRIAMTAIAEVPTWELLQATNVTDAQLAAVQHGWQQLDFIDEATNVFRLERAFSMETIEKARGSHEEFRKILGMVSSMSASSGGGWSWPPNWDELTEKPRLAAAEAMWRSSWSYADELQLMESHQIVLEALWAMHTNQSQFYLADYNAMTRRLPVPGVVGGSRALFRSLKIPDLSDLFSGWSWLGSAVQKTLRIETARRIVTTAIALKRYQLKHGAEPEMLRELVPEFLASVPIDPYDGKSLKYLRNTDGTYLLYSSAENGVDDGGSPALPTDIHSMYWLTPKARDWVWPQPASAVEIKAYNDAEAAKAAAAMPVASPVMPLSPVPAGTN